MAVHGKSWVAWHFLPATKEMDGCLGISCPFQQYFSYDMTMRGWPKDWVQWSAVSVEQYSDPGRFNLQFGALIARSDGRFCNHRSATMSFCGRVYSCPSDCLLDYLYLAHWLLMVFSWPRKVLYYWYDLGVKGQCQVYLKLVLQLVTRTPLSCFWWKGFIFSTLIAYGV